MSDTVPDMLTILHVQGTRRVKIHKASRDAMREAAFTPLAMNSRGRFVYMTGVQVILSPMIRCLLACHAQSFCHSRGAGDSLLESGASAQTCLWDVYQATYIRHSLASQS